MKNKSKASIILLTFVRITGFIPALLLFKSKKHYVNRFSKDKHFKGPAIVMSNHTSLMDFAFFLMTFPFTTIHFLIAEVMYNKGKLFSLFLNKLGGIKVNRNNFEFGFIADSINVLDNGGLLGIFPESKLPVKGKMSPFKPSVVVIALESGAPIIPVYIDGKYSILHRTNIMIGEKIYLNKMCDSKKPTKEEINRLCKYLQDETIKLANELEKRKKK